MNSKFDAFLQPVIHIQTQTRTRLFIPQNLTADSKLNNLTRLEPTLALLEIPFDTNTARNIMNQDKGAATRLLYQLFIKLGEAYKDFNQGRIMKCSESIIRLFLSKVTYKRVD